MTLAVSISSKFKVKKTHLSLRPRKVWLIWPSIAFITEFVQKKWSWRTSYGESIESVEIDCMIFVRFINMINRIIHAGTKWTRICQICRPSLTFCYGRRYSCILLWIFVYRLITLLLENNAAPILRTDFLYLKIMFSFINFISIHFQNTFKPANCRVAKIRRGRKHTGRYLFWICHENSD